MHIETILAITTASVLGLLAWRAGSHLSDQKRVSPLLFGCVVLLGLAISWTLSGRLWWARVLPFVEVIHWSNLMPSSLCFAAGLARGVPGLHRWHRPVTMGILLALAIAFLAAPVYRPVLSPTDVGPGRMVGWREGVCLQTHRSSCGAAAAATLLSHHRIDTNESEMIGHCLTSGFGTEPLGLYRGLSMMARRNGLKAVAAGKDPGHWVADGHLPNVAIVRFAGIHRPGGLRRVFGAAGERHAVTVIAPDERGGWLVADPAVGLVRWNDNQLREQFTGEAIMILGNR